MIAFVREVARSLARCELTFLARTPIDVPQAQRQHAQYVAELSELGCRIEWLPPLAEHPDGVFVEDTAVLVPEVAVITRPGAASRRAEVESVAAALARHVPVRRVTDPACLEGGDVLRIGRTLYVGASGRTNPAGVAQLAEGLAPFGYAVREVALHHCLHLKSACTLNTDQPPRPSSRSLSTRTWLSRCTCQRLKCNFTSVKTRCRTFLIPKNARRRRSRRGCWSNFFTTGSIAQGSRKICLTTFPAW